MSFRGRRAPRLSLTTTNLCETEYYRKSRGLRASGFKGIDLNLSDMKPGGIKFESDAVVFRKRAQ